MNDTQLILRAASIAKRRGRPRSSANPKTAADNRVIALTVYNLVCWGFPLRSRGDSAGVCELVALQARQILKRTDNYGRALGPDRVEQIFEEWFKAEQATRKERGIWPLKKRQCYTKESLAERIPDKRLMLEGLAAELLSNEGKWVRPGRALPHGDLVLTPKLGQQKFARLKDSAVNAVVQRVMQRFAPVDSRQTEILELMITRCFGLGYRAGAFGEAPDSLKNGVEK